MRGNKIAFNVDRDSSPPLKNSLLLIQDDSAFSNRMMTSLKPNLTKEGNSTRHLRQSSVNAFGIKNLNQS